MMVIVVRRSGIAEERRWHSQRTTTDERYSSSEGWISNTPQRWFPFLILHTWKGKDLINVTVLHTNTRR